MDIQNKKCVMILDGSLSAGISANTAAILGITLGKLVPHTVGPDVTDKSGNTHAGIIALPVPVLKADGEKIRQIRRLLYQSDYAEITAADFSDVAQGCNVYEEFIGKIAAAAEDNIAYFGIALYGPKKLVNKLTGNLPLLK